VKRALACLLIASSIPALARAEDAPAASSQRSKKKARKKQTQPSPQGPATNATTDGSVETSDSAAARPPPEEPAPPLAPVAVTPSLNFDLLDEPGTEPKTPLQPLRDPAIDAMVKRRRAMLHVHQALGFATWAGLAATEVVGQLAFNDKYRGGGDTGRYTKIHLGLALGTTALFSTVALLGVLAPVPYEKHSGFDTATLHKIMMAVATAGMLTQVALGIYTNSRDGNLDQRAFAQAHQIVGYATWGAMTVGAVTLFF
jgi:hypothetical protein